MRIDVLTLFPDMFSPLEQSIVGRARQQGIVDIRLTNIRDFSTDKHRIVDDTPYGGGPGMVMKPEPLFAAVETVKGGGDGHVILLDPQGKPFNQKRAWQLAKKSHLVFVCGHYEGVDERVRTIVDEELSIGDYVLTGGEMAALVVIDAITRLLPGALGEERSALEDSFEGNVLDHPQYTRPVHFRGMDVPPVLLSGHHENIRRWRRREALRKTLLRRPDLLDAADLDDEDRNILEQLRQELSLS